ncbi:hypothetical protein ANN_01237 [Periplaneta americana]|uniref:Uncharacterized protein n=1 Tax=Periplaneta americana TaxID=6978 RepID=A0ABQ8TT01_PERAM|nr:hypothetical protein ANN_01237 [Periplaneta americana]
MAGLYEGGNEPPGSLKAIYSERVKELMCLKNEGWVLRRKIPSDLGHLVTRNECTSAHSELDIVPLSHICDTVHEVNYPKTGLNPISDTKKTPLMRQLDQKIMG